MARLVAHEIDHLNGILYRSRMQAGAETNSGFSVYRNRPALARALREAPDRRHYPFVDVVHTQLTFESAPLEVCEIRTLSSALMLHVMLAPCESLASVAWIEALLTVFSAL